MFLAIEFSLTIASYQFLKMTRFTKIMAYYFGKNILYISSVSNFDVSLNKNLLTFSAAENFTFKSGNCRVVENIFFEKVRHDL